MRLSDLQQKAIISVKSGKNLGNIIDVEITLDGMVSAIIIEEHGFFKNIFHGGSEVSIKVKDIIKIGEDVILVNV